MLLRQIPGPDRENIRESWQAVAEIYHATAGRANHRPLSQAPPPVSMVSLTAAQRYSVLVTARNDTSSNWAIHANMDTTMFDVIPDTLVYSKFYNICYSQYLSVAS